MITFDGVSNANHALVCVQCYCLLNAETMKFFFLLINFPFDFSSRQAQIS